MERLGPELPVFDSNNSNAARSPMGKWKLRVILLLHGHYSVAAQGSPVHYPRITGESIAPDGTVAHTT